MFAFNDKKKLDYKIMIVKHRVLFNGTQLLLDLIHLTMAEFNHLYLNFFIDLELFIFLKILKNYID